LLCSGRNSPLPERHHLRALDLLRRARPPRTRGDRVVVGDHHHPATLDARERGHHTGTRRALVAGEHLAVVDERADLERARARIDEARDPLARGELALLVDALDVARAPAGLDLLAARAQAIFERREGRALVGDGALVDQLGQGIADRDERDERHARATLRHAHVVRRARTRRSCREAGQRARAVGIRGCYQGGAANGIADQHRRQVAAAA